MKKIWQTFELLPDLETGIFKDIKMSFYLFFIQKNCSREKENFY